LSYQREWVIDILNIKMIRSYYIHINSIKIIHIFHIGNWYITFACRPYQLSKKWMLIWLSISRDLYFIEKVK
jgi:hypothetical protein